MVSTRQHRSNSRSPRDTRARRSPTNGPSPASCTRHPQCSPAHMRHNFSPVCPIGKKCLRPRHWHKSSPSMFTNGASFVTVVGVVISLESLAPAAPSLGQAGKTTGSVAPEVAPPFCQGPKWTITVITTAAANARSSGLFRETPAPFPAATLFAVVCARTCSDGVAHLNRAGIAGGGLGLRCVFHDAFESPVEAWYRSPRRDETIARTLPRGHLAEHDAHCVNVRTVIHVRCNLQCRGCHEIRHAVVQGDHHPRRTTDSTPIQASRRTANPKSSATVAAHLRYTGWSASSGF